MEYTKRDVESKGKQQQPEPRPLAPVKKEEWPKVVCTGNKYIRACGLTRATVHAYADSLHRQELTGFSDYEEWQAHKKKHQGVPLAKRASASPQRPTEASGSGGGARSSSPAGPAPLPPQPKKMPASKVAPAAGPETFQLSEAASSKASDGTRERWSITEDSALGAPDDEGALEELKSKVDAARLAGQGSAPSAAVSACGSAATGDDWNIVGPVQRQKRKLQTETSSDPATAEGPADSRSAASNASQTSKLSRVSAASINRAGAFFKKHPLR